MPSKKQKIVIIGAGPIGLYTALRLKKTGVKDVLVIDPRAGVYTRPGHINASVFDSIYQGLGIKSFFTTFGHIKDIERFLYQECRRYNVKFKAEKFEALKERSITLGNGDEVKFDYLIDCSGQKRVVINAANQRLMPNPPFSLTEVANVSTKRHLIAYVRLSSVQLDRINLADNLLTQNILLDDIGGIEKLRDLGWTHYFTPSCYGMNFGKSKACLYMEIPDACAVEHHEDWVRAVIRVVSGDNSMDFEFLPPSKKYHNKPRFNAFTVNPSELKTLYHQNIICLGDAIIGPDYRLAHGVEDGVKIVDAFIDNLTIFDGIIYDFDGEEFTRLSKQYINQHRQALTDFYKRLDKRELRGLEQAKSHYDALLKHSNGLNTGQLLHQIRQINLKLGLLLLKSCLGDEGTSIQLDTHGMLAEPIKLKRVLSLILDGFISTNDLYDYKVQLLHYCLALKNTGGKLYNSKRYPSALKCYQHAKELNDSLQLGMDDETQFIIETNIMLCHIQNKNYELAIDGAKWLAEDAGDLAMVISSPRIEEFLYNFIRALALKIEKLQGIETCEQENSLLEHAWECKSFTDQPLLSDKNKKLLEKRFPEIMTKPVDEVTVILSTLG